MMADNFESMAAMKPAVSATIAGINDRPHYRSARTSHASPGAASRNEVGQV